jgi:hypothetical protein
MRDFLKPTRAAFIVAGSLVAVVAGMGSAGAVTDIIFKYKTPKTGYFTVGPMSLIPDSAGATGDYVSNYAAGTFTGQGCFNTGVNLPNGATITKIAVSYKSGVAHDIDVLMSRFPVAGGVPQAVAQQTIVDNKDLRKMVALTPVAANAVVNNLSFAYGIAFCLGTGDTFYAARILYTYDNAGD